MAARDIQRWVDDASDVEACLREALRDAAREAPSTAQLDKLVAGVDSALRVGATTPSPPRPSLIVLGCVGMVLVSAGAWLVHRHYSAATQPTAASQPVQRAAPGPLPADPSAPASPVAPEAAAQQIAASPAAPDVPPPVAAAPRHSPRRVRPNPNPNASPTPPVDPAQEVLLLRDAKRALGAAPARARQLLLEHQRSYAHGAFVEEREALLIELLLREGDAQQARARLADFRQRFAGSAYQRRLDELLLQR